MARIPDANALTKRIPQSRRGITSDRSGEILGEAAVELGQAFGRAEERRDKFRYGKAKSELLQADIRIRRELESDPNADWTTMESKYRDQMKKARETAGAGISDRNDRAYFDQDSDIDLERGALAIAGISRAREIDAGRADLDTHIAGNRAAALNATDAGTRTALLNATKDLITGATRPSASGAVILSQEAAASTWLKFQESYGEGFVAMMDPEEREGVLQNPVGTPAEFIPPDQRVLLLRSAQTENKERRIRTESKKLSEDILAGGGSLEAMRAKARKIEDAEVSDATILRLEGRFADREADRERYDRQARREMWDIIDKTGDLDAVPTSLLARVDPEDRVRAKDYLQKDGKVTTNVGVWYGLTQMAGDDPIGFAEVDLLRYRNAIDEEDLQQLAKQQEAIRENVRAGDAIQTDNQIVLGALRELKVKTAGSIPQDDAERAAEFRYAFQKAVNDQFRVTGKQPSVEDKEKIRDALMVEVVSGTSWWGGTKKSRLFEADEVREVVIPKEERKKIIAALQKRGVEATEDRIQYLYLRNKGLASKEDAPE